MILTEGQKKAVDITVERYKKGEKYTVISGRAGSGKSVTIQYVLESLGIDKSNVCYCCFTGKACQVLIDRGIKNAVTAHKLLYHARLRPDGKYAFTKKPDIEYKVIIVDECSMLPMKMVQQLLAYPEAYIIFSGDSNQLPPILEKDNNHLLDNPHIELTEIMRQAKDSGIIALGEMILNGENIRGFSTEDALVLPKSQLDQEKMFPWADIILCSTNKTREKINAEMRRMLCMEGYIDPRDKIINLNNRWDLESKNGNALTNGVIGTLKDIKEVDIKTPKYLGISNNIIPLIRGKFTSETGDYFGDIDIDRNYFINKELTIKNQSKYLMMKSKTWAGYIPCEFTYGYAITTWKAQGSEWDKVLIFEEAFPFDKEEHKKFLYTAITRASKKVVLITK